MPLDRAEMADAWNEAVEQVYAATVGDNRVLVTMVDLRYLARHLRIPASAKSASDLHQQVAKALWDTMLFRAAGARVIAEQLGFVDLFCGKGEIPPPRLPPMPFGRRWDGR